MTLRVDTSVWSLALRRDETPAVPEARALRDALLAQLCIRLVSARRMTGLPAAQRRDKILTA